jgi:hypothetical protein
MSKDIETPQNQWFAGFFYAHQNQSKSLEINPLVSHW